MNFLNIIKSFVSKSNESIIETAIKLNPKTAVEADKRTLQDANAAICRKLEVAKTDFRQAEVELKVDKAGYDKALEALQRVVNDHTCTDNDKHKAVGKVELEEQKVNLNESKLEFAKQRLDLVQEKSDKIKKHLVDIDLAITSKELKYETAKLLKEKEEARHESLKYKMLHGEEKEDIGTSCVQTLDKLAEKEEMEAKALKHAADNLEEVVSVGEEFEPELDLDARISKYIK